MKKYSPVKLDNLSSDICCVNLRLLQNLQIRIPYFVFKIDNNSKFLRFEQKSSNFFEIYQINKELENWKFSNLYLGNIEIFSNSKRSSLCVFLENDSKFLTITNPEGRIRASTDQIVEFVLFSDSKEDFNFDSVSIKKIGYKVCDNNNNNLIYDLYKNSCKFQHHVWVKFSSRFIEEISFKGKDRDYVFLLEVKNSKQKNYYYTKTIRLIRK